MNKMSVKDLTDLKGKRVLVRCDFNVPMKDGVITDENRIQGAFPLSNIFWTRAQKLRFARIWASPTPFFPTR